MAIVPAISEGVGRLTASMMSLVAATGDERTRLAALWRKHVQDCEAASERESVIFEDIYRDAVQCNWGSADIEDFAAAILEEQQKIAAHIDSAAAALHLAPRSEDPEELQVLERGLEIARRTIDNLELLRGRLLALAEEHAGRDKTLRARPVRGEIDYGGLSREHIARYPKIRAALAE